MSASIAVAMRKHGVAGGVVMGSADLSAAPDRAAVGTISKQAGLSKFQVSGVGRRQPETVAEVRHKPGMN